MKPETEFLLSFAALHEGTASKVQDLIEVFAAITTPVKTTGALYHHLYGAWTNFPFALDCDPRHKKAFMERARTHREFILTPRPPPEPYSYKAREKPQAQLQTLDPTLQALIEKTELFQSARAIGRLTRLRLITRYELQIPIVKVAAATMVGTFTRPQAHEIMNRFFPDRHPRSFYRWTEPVPGMNNLLVLLRLK